MNHPTLEQLKLAESLVSEWLTEAAADKSRFTRDIIDWDNLRVTECMWAINSLGCGFIVRIFGVHCTWQLEEFLLAKWQESELSSHKVRLIFEW